MNDYLKYLIEQAKQKSDVETEFRKLEMLHWEETNKLEQENKKLREELEDYKMKYENTGSMFGRQAQRTLLDENKRLREALDFYANANTIYDSGEKAIKALEDNQ